jgi:hypothetical protein
MLYSGRRDMKFKVPLNELAIVWCTEASSMLRTTVPYSTPKLTLEG